MIWHLKNLWQSLLPRGSVVLHHGLKTSRVSTDLVWLGIMVDGFENQKIFESSSSSSSTRQKNVPRSSLEALEAFDFLDNLPAATSSGCSIAHFFWSLYGAGKSLAKSQRPGGISRTWGSKSWAELMSWSSVASGTRRFLHYQGANEEVLFKEKKKTSSSEDLGSCEKEVLKLFKQICRQIDFPIHGISMCDPNQTNKTAGQWLGDGQQFSKHRVWWSSWKKCVGMLRPQLHGACCCLLGNYIIRRSLF